MRAPSRSPTLSTVSAGSEKANALRAAAPALVSDERVQQVRDAVDVVMLSTPALTSRKVREVEALATSATREICDHEVVTSWDSADCVGIAALREFGRLGKGVRVVASISEFPAPRTFRNGESRDVVGTALRLCDASGESIGTLGIVGDGAIRDLYSLRARGAVEFLGRPALVPRLPGGVRLDFVLEVIGARRATSALDALAAAPKEREETDRLLADLKGRSCSPLDYLQGELERGLGIVGLEESPVLRQSIRFTILQSVSCGCIGQSSGKVHALIIGPPAQGKKLVGLAARALNHQWREASAAKITGAGLVGASSHSASGWHSQAGLLPQADSGVLILQDAHAIPRSRIQQIAPILQEVIEDGIVRDSVAGGERRSVSVGLVIDLNRLGQVSSARMGEGSPEAPILAIRPLLSRVDFITEILPDPRRAWETSAGLYASLSTTSVALESAPWVRRVRLLVAALRDRHAAVAIEPVAALMKATHEQIAADNEQAISAMPEAGDIPMRLAISFARLVAASARANDRPTATAADVHEAMTFLAKKLEFLKLVASVEQLPEPRSGLARIEDVLRERFADGRKFSVDDVISLHVETTGNSCSDRSARRWIHELRARRVKKGVYTLKTAAAASAEENEPVNTPSPDGRMA